MKKILPAILASVVFLFSSFNAISQSCSLLIHNSFTDFNGTPKPAATSLWLHIDTKLDNTDLANNGDYLLFTGGTISLTGVTSSPMVTNEPIPDGKIIADNTVTKPVTSYDIPTNTWTTRVPPGFSSSDIFISGAIINSSTGFSVSGGKSSTLAGMFFSNRPSFKQSWFYGLAAYQPQFGYSAISSQGQVASVGGGIQAGTPIPEEHFLVAGGSGGGGSNFTGSNSSTDNFMTCQKAACNLSGAFTKTDVTCNGAANGSATITLTGGTPPYLYTTIGGPYQTSSLVTPFYNLTPGTYPVMITDNAGCKVSLSITITQPPVLQLTGLVVNTSDNLSNGSISLTVSGGTPPYAFLWNTGATSQNLSGLGAGTYSVTVSDANGCTAGFTGVLGGQVCTSLGVTATVVRGDFENSCDGEATISVTGGVAPFTYVWSDGVTTSTNTRDNLCGPPAGSGTPVQYTVIVTDANGCSGNTSFIIDVTSNAPSNTSSVARNGIAEPLGETGKTMAVRTYPNPSNGLMYLQVDSKENTTAAINVVDMTGRIVKTFVVSFVKGTNYTQLQLPIHAARIYMLQIKTSKEMQTLPVLLNK